MGLIGNWYRAKCEETDARGTEAKLYRQRLEAASTILDHSNPNVIGEDPDAKDWTPVSGVTGEFLRGSTYEEIRDKSRSLRRNDPIGRNIIDQFTNYTIGGEWRFSVEFKDASIDADEPSNRTLLQDTLNFWNEFVWRASDRIGDYWQEEHAERVWRDGEQFTRLIFNESGGVPLTTFVEPERIGPPNNQAEPTYGIETSPNDVMDVQNYYVLNENGTQKAKVPAEQMVHSKIGVDGNVKRGISILYPVFDYLRRFNGWMETELIARKVASSVVLVRKHKGSSPGQVTASADAQKTGTTNYPEGGMRRQKLRPGTILDINDSIDLQLLEPKGHYADADVLGRRILLMIASGVGMPEYILTSDASNANFASTMVAEGPFVQAIVAWRRYFLFQYRRTFVKILRSNSEFVDRVDQLILNGDGGNLVVRDRLQDRQADKIGWEIGALSPQEVSRREGVEPEQMQRENEDAGAHTGADALNEVKAVDALNDLDAEAKPTGDEDVFDDPDGEEG